MLVVAFAALAATYYGLRMGPTRTSAPVAPSESVEPSTSPSAPAVMPMGMPEGAPSAPMVDPSTQIPPPPVDARCPAGMEFLDEFATHGAGGAKGCVARRADGSLSREGRWAVKLTGDRVMYGNYEKGLYEGHWTTWYEQGGKAEETDYQHGIRHGWQVEWNKEGQKVVERHYDKGGLDGPVTIFMPDGSLVRQVWKEGRQIDPPPDEPPIKIQL